MQLFFRRCYSSSVRPRMFRKVLIANRGEIAVRVMRSAREIGVKTVAVFSDADAHSRHVQLADEAYHIGPAPSSQSYLDMEKLLEVAHKSGAEAIHPGYGFLSENAKFAALCKEKNVEFIGPPPSAIEDMGSKSASKRIMESAGVPVVGGYHGDDQSFERLSEEADKIGYPVMIKAVLGGGGKGMRIVENKESFKDMLEASRREAIKSFSDDRVLVEKYIVQPRHVEVQVFADKHGNCVYLFERDCSVQRRHQKVIEEAPAPGLSDEKRREIGEAAVRAAKAVNYVGAGTVEFIVDAQQNFFFMEMNTRLQVEHPVSEMITGRDLVMMQLQAAAGFPMELKQEDLKINGHSFEARIYAEDPENNFLPGTGPLIHLSTPEPSTTCRVETGVREGDEVTVYYDPMIAKLVVWAEDRESALQKLINGLHEYRVVGLKTNIEFASKIASHPAFAKTECLETGFIEKYKADIFASKPAPGVEIFAQAALTLLLTEQERGAQYAMAHKDPSSPFNGPCRYLGMNAERTVALTFGDEEKEIKVTYLPDGTYEMAIGGETCRVEGEYDSTNKRLVARVNGQLHKTTSLLYNNKFHVFNNEGYQYEVGLKLPSYMSAVKSDLASAGGIVAPMTGKIEKVVVKANETVKEGDPLVILEAMKMEHVIRAPRDGVVNRINFVAGELVDQNSLLVVMEEDS
eukprot:Nk52_evm15s228 gene=Nk52_evmTU15s228